MKKTKVRRCHECGKEIKIMVRKHESNFCSALCEERYDNRPTSTR